MLYVLTPQYFNPVQYGETGTPIYEGKSVRYLNSFYFEGSWNEQSIIKRYVRFII